MVKPQSAMIAMPFRPSSFSRNPEWRVSSTSEIDPTYNGEILRYNYDIAPLGVHATKNFAVYIMLFVVAPSR